VNDLNEQMYELNGLECLDFALIKLAAIRREEKEHVIRCMTENASQFVRLIVKECIDRIPVSV